MLQDMNRKDSRIQRQKNENSQNPERTASTPSSNAEVDSGNTIHGKRLLLTMKNSRGETPLMMAVEHLNEDAIWLLLSRGSDPTQQNKYGDTALHIVASLGQQPLLNLISLISKSMETKTKKQTEHRKTKLGFTSNKKIQEDMRLLFEIRNHKGESVLLVAAREVYADALRLLVDRGADVSVRDMNGNTALMLLVANCRERIRDDPPELEPLIDLLVYNSSQNGTNRSQIRIDVNARNNFGHSALTRALIGSHLSVVRKLIDLGAEVNCTDVDGKTALHAVADASHNIDKVADVIEILLENGACVNALSFNGLRPLNYAMINRSSVAILSSNGTQVTDALEKKISQLMKSHTKLTQKSTLSGHSGRTIADDIDLLSSITSDLRPVLEGLCVNCSAQSVHLSAVEHDGIQLKMKPFHTKAELSVNLLQNWHHQICYESTIKTYVFVCNSCQRSTAKMMIKSLFDADSSNDRAATDERGRTISHLCVIDFHRLYTSWILQADNQKDNPFNIYGLNDGDEPLAFRMIANRLPQRELTIRDDQRRTPLHYLAMWSYHLQLEQFAKQMYETSVQ